MKNECLGKRAREHQAFADASDVKSYHGAFKMVYGPRHGPSSSLYSKDGTATLRSFEDIKKQGTEHFEDLLSTSDEVNFDVISDPEQKHIHWSIDQTPMQILEEHAFS